MTEEQDKVLDFLNGSIARAKVELRAEYSEFFEAAIENALETAYKCGVIEGKKLTKTEEEKQDDGAPTELANNDRRKQLMNMYISEGMMVEDLIEMIVSLEKK